MAIGASMAQTPSSPAQPHEVVVSQVAAYRYPTPSCGDDYGLNQDNQACDGAKAVASETNQYRYYHPGLNCTVEVLHPEFAYRMTVTNSGKKTVRFLEWEYIIVDQDTQNEVARHRFGSWAMLRPGERKTVIERSLSPPTRVISVKALSSSEPYSEMVILQRIVYADGSVWTASPLPSEQFVIDGERTRKPRESSAPVSSS